MNDLPHLLLEKCPFFYPSISKRITNLNSSPGMQSVIALSSDNFAILLNEQANSNMIKNKLIAGNQAI